MNSDPNVIALRGHEAEQAKSQADQERIDALQAKYQPEEREYLRRAESGALLHAALGWAAEQGLEHGTYAANSFHRHDYAAIGRIAYEIMDRYLEARSWELARERATAEVERENDDSAPWLGPEGAA